MFPPFAENQSLLRGALLGQLRVKRLKLQHCLGGGWAFHEGGRQRAMSDGMQLQNKQQGPTVTRFHFRCGDGTAQFRTG